MHIDQQIEKLNHAYDVAIKDAEGDMGEEAVDGGGWIEIARAVCDLVGPEITEEAKNEFLRCQGLPRLQGGPMPWESDYADDDTYPAWGGKPLLGHPGH